MNRLLVLIALLVGCGDDGSDDLPTCAELGCDHNALCTRDGDCRCLVDDGEPIACRLETPDAGAQ